MSDGSDDDDVTHIRFHRIGSVGLERSFALALLTAECGLILRFNNRKLEQMEVVVLNFELVVFWQIDYFNNGWTGTSVPQASHKMQLK